MALRIYVGVALKLEFNYETNPLMAKDNNLKSRRCFELLSSKRRAKQKLVKKRCSSNSYFFIVKTLYHSF